MSSKKNEANALSPIEGLDIKDLQGIRKELYKAFNDVAMNEGKKVSYGMDWAHKLSDIGRNIAVVEEALISRHENSSRGSKPKVLPK